jgi:hypothetical protein
MERINKNLTFLKTYALCRLSTCRIKLLTNATQDEIKAVFECIINMHNMGLDKGERGLLKSNKTILSKLRRLKLASDPRLRVILKQYNTVTRSIIKLVLSKIANEAVLYVMT